jgi:peptide/nickel transport system substrate-binding protein
MSKKVLWFGLSISLVLSLILSSCAKATTTTMTNLTTTTSTKTTTSTTSTTVTTTTAATNPTTATSNTPQYGGTLTVVGYRTASPPLNWDTSVTNASTDYWTDPYSEFLLAGDIDGKGPRGTNAFSFQIQETIPQQFLTGELAASYEQPDPLTLIFHMRQGVMWTGNNNIGMAPREFTANDAAFELNRYWKSINGGGNLYYFDSITAQDKYTLVMKFNTYSPDWLYRVGYGYKCGMVPTEEVTAGALNWKNQVGTGPFILTDYVDGSEATYTRNPNYWGVTTINGKSYQLPFVQTLKYPVILDLSTEIAAVRTGKVDIGWAIPMTYKTNLNTISPDLTTYSYLKNNYYQILFRCDKGIFQDVNVRRAMMVGTDLKKIGSSVFPGGFEINNFPLAPNLPGISTPINEYPASTQALFNYDPNKAKQMLVSAGYPNPFTVEITFQSTSEQNDIVAALADQWSKFGVTLKLKPVDAATWANIFANKSYSDIFVGSTGNSNPVSSLQYKALPGPFNLSNYSDDKAATLFNQALGTADPVAQNALFKQLNAYIVDQCPLIGMPAPYQLETYWPWVKNYFNEVEGGYQNYLPIVRLIWVDQNLKKSSGH